MNREQLFKKVRDIRVGIIGDFCIDIYWSADMKKSELSRETPHFPLPVTSERVYPGAAGNLAANVAALGVASVRGITVCGDDWRRELLQRQLDERGISVDFIAERGRFTNAYIKPLRMGISDIVYEDPRLDFANYAPISEKTESEVLSALERLCENIDLLLVCDQFDCGTVTPAVREKICSLAESGLEVAVDSRNHIADYRGVWAKPNETECSRALGADIGEIGYERAAEQLAGLCGNVLLTLGENGCVLCHDENMSRIPAVKVDGQIDICGAGDTFMACFGVMLAAGAEPEEAAALAARASAVTVKKIGVTGTATLDEIAAI